MRAWETGRRGLAVGYALGTLVAAGGALAVPVLLTVFAGPASDYFAAAAAQLHAPAAYVDAVLGAR